MNKLYPWQSIQWKQIVVRLRQGSLPHSLLLTGLPGLGKLDFARHFANSLFCDQPDEQGHSCGQCKACMLLQAGTHPDYHELMPEEKSKVIKIDQVRELSDVMARKSQLGGYRVAILSPAENMNTNAANGLLKTLEEPGEKTVILLVSSQPGYLPATIRSRCQKVEFHAPGIENSVNWLKEQGVTGDIELLLGLSQKTPLAALEGFKGNRLQEREVFISEFLGLKQGIQNPLQMADKWNKLQPKQCLEWMMSWVMDLIRLKSNANSSLITNSDIKQHLQPIAEQLELINLFSYQDKLQLANRQLATQVNVQLLLEDLFITWIKIR